MEVIHPDGGITEAARSIISGLDAGHDVVINDLVIPPQVVDGIRPILELLADGRPAWLRSGEYVPDELRPKCAGCGEPLELENPDDPESWIHAEDASYFGDHTAWLT